MENSKTLKKNSILTFTLCVTKKGQQSLWFSHRQTFKQIFNPYTIYIYFLNWLRRKLCFWRFWKWQFTCMELHVKPKCKLFNFSCKVGIFIAKFWKLLISRERKGLHGCLDQKRKVLGDSLGVRNGRAQSRRTVRRRTDSLTRHCT